MLGAPAVDVLEVEPLLAMDAPRDVRDGDHPGAAEHELVRRHARRPSRSPGRRRRSRRAGSRAELERLVDHHDDADPGRLRAKHRPADRQRLPGHDLRHRVPDLHRVRVHHPGHRLLVGGHVRSGDVALGPDDRQELRGEAPRQALALCHRRSPWAGNGRRPSRRRTGAGGARTSRSSTWRARRTPRASPPGRSGSRPSSARARSNAARGSPGRRRGAVVELNRDRHRERALGEAEDLGRARRRRPRAGERRRAGRAPFERADRRALAAASLEAPLPRSWPRPESNFPASAGVSRRRA